MSAGLYYYTSMPLEFFSGENDNYYFFFYFIENTNLKKITS